MKRIIAICVFVLFSIASYAQRCAVMEFKAGGALTQNDVDGLSDMFLTYFHPAGYTMVERSQVDGIIEEQGFQRSNLTENQMVQIGRLLNVSAIVVGNINLFMGQTSIDVRVLNVETGALLATCGADFVSGKSNRETVQKLANELMEKLSSIPIQSNLTATLSTPVNNRRNRSDVETLYGYLKIFPNELGEFPSEPKTVISQINSQSQYGVSTWRIPTEEEIALLRANNYIGRGQYITKEDDRGGLVLLVSDGNGNSQTTTNRNPEDAISFELLTVRPSFQGKDMASFSSWVSSNLQYPDYARNNGIQGRVIVRFTIDEEGNVTRVHVLRGVEPSLDNEAVRVISNSPKWSPGLMNGKVVKTIVNSEVVFQIR